MVVEVAVLTDRLSESDPIHSKYRQSHSSICALLRERGYRVRSLFAGLADDPEVLFANPPDFVLICYSNGAMLCRSLGGSGLLNYLERKGIPYSGSDEAALTLQADKAQAKERVSRHGILTADSWVVSPTNVDMPNHHCWPLFVKPLYGGDSIGIDHHSIVRNQEQLRFKVSQIHKNYEQPALIETYLSGREFTVAIFKSQRGYDSFPVEVIPPATASGERIVGLKRLRAESDPVVTQCAVHDLALAERLSTTAVSAFAALGGRGHGRIDLRMDANGLLHFLEANLMPGLGLSSSYISIALGLNGQGDWRSVITRILSIAAEERRAEEKR